MEIERLESENRALREMLEISRAENEAPAATSAAAGAPAQVDADAATTDGGDDKKWQIVNTTVQLPVPPGQQMLHNMQQQPQQGTGTALGMVMGGAA